MPEFIDREMDNAFGHAAIWYMQGPFPSALPELGYQSPLTPCSTSRTSSARASSAFCCRTPGSVIWPIHGGNKDLESWKMIGFPGARADFLDKVDEQL